MKKLTVQRRPFFRNVLGDGYADTSGDKVVRVLNCFTSHYLSRRGDKSCIPKTTSACLRIEQLPSYGFELSIFEPKILDSIES